MQDEVLVWPQAKNSELHDQPPPHERFSLVLTAKWQFSISRNNTTAKSPQSPSTSVTSKSHRGLSTSVTSKSHRGQSTSVTSKSHQGLSTSVTSKSHRGQSTSVISKSHQGLSTSVTAKSHWGPEQSDSSLLYHDESPAFICKSAGFPDRTELIDHTPAAAEVWPQAQNSELHDQPPSHEKVTLVLTATWQFFISRNNTIIKAPRGLSISVRSKSLQGPEQSDSSLLYHNESPDFICKSAGFPGRTEFIDHTPAAAEVWPQAQNSELHDQPPSHERVALVITAKWQFSISRSTTTAKSTQSPVTTFTTKSPRSSSTSVTVKSPSEDPKDSIYSSLYYDESQIKIRYTSAKSSLFLLLLQSSIGIDQSFLGTHHQRDEGWWSTSPVPSTPDLRLQQEEKSDAKSSPSYAILQCPKDSSSGSQSGTGIFLTSCIIPQILSQSRTIA